MTRHEQIQAMEHQELPPKRCQTCQHHDDYIRKCICGDEDILPDPLPDEPPCTAWEPKKNERNFLK